MQVNGLAEENSTVKILSSGIPVTGSLGAPGGIVEHEDYQITTEGPDGVTFELTTEGVTATVTRLVPIPGLPDFNLECPAIYAGECPNLAFVLPSGTPLTPKCTLAVDESTKLCVRVFGDSNNGSYTLTANLKSNDILLEEIYSTKEEEENSYTIKLMATDPNDNLQKIEIDWTNKGQIEDIEEKPASSGEEVTFTHSYPEKASYTWTATAYDANGVKSNPVSGTVPEIGKEVKNDSKENTCDVGDPIDPATGAQVLSHDLLSVQGVLPLSFSIHYHSLLLKEGILGRAWGHNRFDASLQKLSKGDVKIHWTNNKSNLFTQNTDGSYKPSHITCQFDTLVKNAKGSFTLTRKNKLFYEFDASGQLVEFRNHKGQSLSFTRDSAGRITQVTEPVSGVFLRYTYNQEGLLESVSDPLERKVTFGYDNHRNLTTITDAASQKTTYTYNEYGQTLAGTNAQGVQFFSNTYNDEYRIVSQDDALITNQVAGLSFDESQPNQIITTFTNRNGDKQVYTYDDNYYLLSFKDELGNTTSHTYDANGQRTSTTDANGNQTQFAYNSQGNLTAITDSANNITQMVYDNNSNLLSVTNALGKKTTYTYDANNNRISTKDTLGNLRQYTYNSDGQVLTDTSPSGAVTTYEYQNGLPIHITDPEGNKQTLSYDVAGRLISITDAEEHTTTFAYDGINRLISVKDALNRTVSMTYDSRDNLLTLTDAKGNVTHRTYDGNGNLISQINALAQETRYEYDGEDRLIKVIDANNNVTQLGYDAKGRLISMTDALGKTQKLSYDAADNLLKQIDALNNVVASFSYDVLNNPISITDTLGHSSQSEYDALSRLTRTTDPLQRATQFNYDDLDRLVSSIDAKNGQSSQTFDSDGNRTGLTDPNSNQTGFKFDKNGRLLEETTASGGSVLYTYNARNLQATVTNARNQERQFEYDVVGRLTRMTDPDGETTYTYDKNDNVLTVTDASGTISREYDALDRVAKYNDSQGNILLYVYDKIGNLVKITYPNAQEVDYEYDAADRLIKVTDWAGRETRYAYDANVKLVQIMRPNGTEMTRSYDAAGELLQQKDATSSGEVISQFDFIYDAAGNIIKEQVAPQPAVFPFKNVTMTYTAANRLATYEGKAVTFDADGNMTAGPLNNDISNFSFDSRNRLVGVANTVYRYDAENQRIAVSVSGQESRYVINPQAVLSQVLVRTVPDGTQTFYVYGLGLIGEETGGVYQAYHFDLRGSTVALSDAAGNVVERFQYSPFAHLVSHNPTEVGTPFLYNGRDGVMTDDSGLYYMRARFYNPEILRFVNQDMLLGSVAEGQTLNRYAYVTGDPISFVDPFGLFSCKSANDAINHLNSYLDSTSTLVACVQLTARLTWKFHSVPNPYVPLTILTVGSIAAIYYAYKVASDRDKLAKSLSDAFYKEDDSCKDDKVTQELTKQITKVIKDAIEKPYDKKLGETLKENFGL